jgi:phage tail tape-measure protein
MTQIVAGTFRNIEPANEAVAALRGEGVPPQRMQIRHVNAPGQHARLPAGGDVDEDAGAREADTGAAAGAVAGGVIGATAGTAIAAAAGAAVAGPVGAVAGAGIGAYVGSLYGALGATQDGDSPAVSDVVSRDPEQTPPRRAGALLAINVLDAREHAAAVRALARCGAEDIEEAYGDWRDGDWVDFDPTQPPRRIAHHAGGTL